MLVAWSPRSCTPPEVGRVLDGDAPPDQVRLPIRGKICGELRPSATGNDRRPGRSSEERRSEEEKEQEQDADPALLDAPPLRMR